MDRNSKRLIRSGSSNQGGLFCGFDCPFNCKFISSPNEPGLEVEPRCFMVVYKEIFLLITNQKPKGVERWRRSRKCAPLYGNSFPTTTTHPNGYSSQHETSLPLLLLNRSIFIPTTDFHNINKTLVGHQLAGGAKWLWVVDELSSPKMGQTERSWCRGVDQCHDMACQCGSTLNNFRVK